MKRSDFVITEDFIVFDSGLTSEEMKMIMLLLNRSNKKGVVAVKEIEILSLTSCASRHEVIVLIDTIIGKTIKESDKAYVWFTEYTFDQDGVITIQINPTILKFIQKGLASIQINSVDGLKNPRSLQLYRLLRKHKTITFKIDDLKKHLKVEDGYGLYADFKRKILIPTVNEVSEKTELSIFYYELKEKRKVIEVRFDISPKIGRQLTLEDVSRSVINTCK